MRRVVVSQRAAKDVEDANQWLTDRGAFSAARDLSELLLTGIGSLAERAERGHPILGDRREINLKHGRSQYIVTYRIRGELVIITPVQHHRARRRLPSRPPTQPSSAD